MNKETEPLQFELFTAQRELAIKRLAWDNEMLEMLETRKRDVLIELVRIDGQIEGIEEDRVRLWGVINKR